MNDKLRILALTMASALLFLTPGPASAQITESDDRPGGSTSVQHWRLDVNEATGVVARVPDWYTTGVAAEMAARTGTDIGAARNDIGSVPDPAGRPDIGAARNDIGPAAPAEPQTTPVTAEVEPGQVIGWTAAGIAAGSALVAAAMFLRRRREHLAHPV